MREIVSLGARSAIMTMPDGCWAQVLVDGAPRVYRVTVPPRGVGRDGRLRRRLPRRATSPRATAAAPPAECLRFGVACGAESTGRLGAGLIDVREVERLLADVAASEVELPAGVG